MPYYPLIRNAMANYQIWLNRMMVNTATRYDAAVSKINDPGSQYHTENAVADVISFWEDALSLYPMFVDTATVMAASITDWTGTNIDTNAVAVKADPTHNFGFSPIVLTNNPATVFPVANMTLTPHVTAEQVSVNLSNGQLPAANNGVYRGYLIDQTINSVVAPIRLYVQI